MDCEVCFKEIEFGRRCAKHHETTKDLIYQELRENASIGMESRLQELEAQSEPCYYQDIPSSLSLPDNGRSEKRVVGGGSEMGVALLPLADSTEQPATPTQFQQIKGELNHLTNRLNEHLDKSKRKVKQYKYD